MIAKKLRAAAAALLLGTAAVAAGSILVLTPAQAAVRAEVGKPLKAAIDAASAGNFQSAMSNLRAAEAVGGLTSEEKEKIAAVRRYIEVNSHGSVGVSTADGARAKFDTDYRAGRYRDTIADEDLLRKFGALDGQSMVIIAQAYYQLGDYKGCLRFAMDHSGAGAAMLERAVQCAYRTGDNNMMRQAAEQLVAASGTPKNWSSLLNLADQAKQMSDPQKLDIYRLRYLTGAMAKPSDDYMTLSQLLIAMRLPTEARSVVEKGMQAKILVDSRAQKLLGRAMQDQARDAATIAAQTAAAKKSPDGDELIRIGQDYTGMGKYPDAIAAINAGIAKGPHDPDMGYVALARAQFGAGQKAVALSTLAKANKSPNGQMMARMWALYMRQH
jgi:tetratricopeptide (TPR) repeat protein